MSLLVKLASEIFPPRAVLQLLLSLLVNLLLLGAPFHPIEPLSLHVFLLAALHIERLHPLLLYLFLHSSLFIDAPAFPLSWLYEE